MENFNSTLHARERELLSYLNSRHTIVTAREISEKMAISQRTIRSDIARINKAMEANGVYIRTIYGKGYSLEIQNREAFHCLFSDEKNIQTREDRIRYLILKLVRSKTTCNLSDLEDDIFISRTTLETDLKEVRRRICENQPFLKMKRCADEMLIEDNELKKRNILIHLYCRDWDYDSRDGITFKDSVMDKETLDCIRVELKKMLDACKLELDDFGLVYLTIALAVCYDRALEGMELKLTGEWKAKYAGNIRREYSIAMNHLTERMSEIWELEIESDVPLWLSVMLCQLNILNLRPVNWQEACEITEPVCLEIEDRTLAMIEDQYGISLKEDREFATNLLIHIQALRNGMISLQPQNLYILEKLKQQFPFLGELACQICRYLEKTCQMMAGTDGEYFLLPLLILAQARQMEMHKEESMRIAVVSHFNKGLTYCLMRQLEQKFGQRVKLDGPYPVYDRNRMEERRPVCILTTVQMDGFRSFDVPVLTVSARLTGNEQEDIEKQIDKMEKQCLLAVLPGERSDYFSSNLSVVIKEKIEFPDILGKMTEQFVKFGFASACPVPDLENGSYVMLENGVMFTCIRGDEQSKTVFGMAELKNTVSWKKYRGIRCVLVLLLNPKQRKYQQGFYQLAQDIAEHQ